MTIWSVEKHPKNLSLEAFSYCLISENNIWIIEENILSKLLNASYILHKKTYRRFTSQKKKKKNKENYIVHPLVIALGLLFWMEFEKIFPKFSAFSKAERQ